jgi:DNA-binding transcriptional LysR family regulator
MLLEARRVLHQAAVAERVAKQVEQRSTLRLRFGYALDCLPPAVARALRAFSGSAPGIELALHAGAAPSLVEDVREGRLDVAAVPLPAATSGLRATPVTREGSVAAVPIMHRFADPAELDIEQLADSTLLMMPRTVNPSFFDGVLAACRSAGFSPSLQESHEPRVESLLMAVALGHGVALLPASAAERYSLAGVRYVPLPAVSQDVAIVAGPNPATPVAQLVKLARDPAPARVLPSPAIAVAA